MLSKIRSFISLLVYNLFCVPIVETYYSGFWNYRKHLIAKGKDRTGIYNAYLERNSASIGLKSQFKTIPILPHGLHGIHISDGSVIGKNVVIFQNVTIGSNTLKGSKRVGAPRVMDNVFIGANASIIGKIIVGNNCRIGANTCVFKDVSDNQTIIGGGMQCILHDNVLDNSFKTMDMLNIEIQDNLLCK